MEAGDPKVIPTSEGGNLIPSVVNFAEDGTRSVGVIAKRQIVSDSEHTLAETKRDMGTDTTYEVRGTKYTPQEIGAFVLQKAKADAEAYLGEEVKKAVVTVPAYFSDSQRTGILAANGVELAHSAMGEVLELRPNIVMDAGGMFNAASCGACFGGMGGVLAEEEVCVSTSNRNYKGRMGHPSSKSYLVSPTTAAVTALEGRLVDPRDHLSESELKREVAA